VSTGPDRGDTPDADVPPDAERGRDTPPATDSRSADPYRVRAKHLLKARGIWKIPVIVGSIEVGPKWRQRAPLAIHRWQTLLTKWALAITAC
jgi:hypothetical protein